jgi:hypothetical protein
MATESHNSGKVIGNDPGKPAATTAKAAEKLRLAAALRENLRRRKAQRRGRSGKDPDAAQAGTAE